jgi:hypothetical protein
MPKRLLLLLSLATSGLNAQYRLYEPNSLQIRYLAMNDLRQLDAFNFYLRDPESAWTWADSEHGEYFRQDHPEHANLNDGAWKKLPKSSIYKNGAWFWSWASEANKPKSFFVINPILDLNSSPPAPEGELRWVNTNTRGAEVFGTIENKIGFYSSIADNLNRFPGYINRYIDTFGVTPGATWWAKYQGGPTNYWAYRGYFNAPLIGEARSNHVMLTAGHDRQKIGIGQRSLFLDDFAPPSAFMRLNTKLGPFRYQNLWKKLTVFGDGFSGSSVLDSKYLIHHRGELHIERWNFDLGFNEMIVAHRPGGGMDVDYLNPIIFYRSIESSLGSGDNALVGFDAALKRKQWALYGQFLLDEFNVSEIVAQNGWWANKFAYQLGIAISPVNPYANACIQVEYNNVRPYTYSHWSELTSLTQFGQPLAHALGSNFREGIFRIDVVPHAEPRLTLSHQTMIAYKGFDNWSEGQNWGGNPVRSYKTRVREYQNKTLQGEQALIVNSRSEALFQIQQNCFLNAGLQTRSQRGFGQQQEFYAWLGIRLNKFTSMALF